MGFFKSWKNTRHIHIGDNISEEQFRDLYKVVSVQAQWKKKLRLVWNIILGICTIIAAVFSVLAFFK